MTALRAGPQRMLDVGHSQLAYWRFGTGPDLVFVHGWPLHAATFRAIVPLLSDAFTCHVLDLPGAGRSRSGADASISFSANAEALRAAIDQLGLKRYAFVAHDSGGLVARLVAAADPRVVALVLSGSEISGYHTPLVALFRLIARLPFGSPVVRWLMQWRVMRRSPLAFRACFDDLAHLDGEFDQLFALPLRRSSAEVKRQFQVLRTLDWNVIDRLPETHARISARVHLIWGSRDGLFPNARARSMLSEFAGSARFSEIPRSRTFVHEERPVEFVNCARPFLIGSFAPAELP